MLTIKNVNTIEGKKSNITLSSAQDNFIEADGLTLLPALIDPHVHFRTPGYEHKEDWRTAAKAAITGGYTMVFDMPNTLPPTVTAKLLREKKSIINAQLQEVDIPLRYQLFFGADKKHIHEIAKVRDEVVGIKVFMGCSTGGLVVDDDETLDAIFKIAAENTMLVAVHAEDECQMNLNKAKYAGMTDYSVHSKIRSIDAAVIAVEKAISLTQKYGTRLYILHVSSAQEIELIKKAKLAGLPVFAETTPHHLFLNDSLYATLLGKAQVNPPLRSSEHQAALFNAIREGVIDTIGTDHAPHTTVEKAKAYGDCPSGMPSIEIVLKLLLNAYHEGKLTLNEIVSLTSKRAKEIFNLPETSDVVLVDLKKETVITDEELHTKCKWSPYAGYHLIGAPVYTILNGRYFNVLPNHQK
jgi:dihydroorotase